MACVSTDLDSAISYALQRLGTPNLILKPEQRSVIESVCNGKDTFVWLPTGFGKSICYQTLPFVFDQTSRKCAAGGSVVVVVSPLISLMEDQVASLRKRGVNAAIVTSGGGVSNEFCAIDDDLGKYSHLFCAPEALISSRWREALERPVISDRIVALVVDEAHCVSKW